MVFDPQAYMEAYGVPFPRPYTGLITAWGWCGPCECFTYCENAIQEDTGEFWTSGAPKRITVPRTPCWWCGEPTTVDHPVWATYSAPMQGITTEQALGPGWREREQEYRSGVYENAPPA